MIKYRIKYKDYFDSECRIDISKDSYRDSPRIIRGVEKSALILTRDCSDDPFDTIINTKAEITIYQDEKKSIDILELQVAQDREFRVNYYINDELKFSGFIISDGIQQNFSSPPFELTLTATDGLMLLNSIPYSDNTLAGGKCILNYLRQVLFAGNNLNLPLPIRWRNTLTNDAYPSENDVLTGSVKWSNLSNEGFIDSQGNPKSCFYVLEGLLKSMQSRIMQVDGRWIIWRINDVVSGVFPMRETPGTVFGFTLLDVESKNYNKTIWSDGDYKFIAEDAIITVLNGLKSVTTTYNQDQRDNVLPNGSMDIVVSGKPLFWDVNVPVDDATVESIPSLSAAKGFAVQVSNPVGKPAATFGIKDWWLPIDTDILYTYINFGFKFCIKSGAVVDGSGIINWDLTPMKIFITYNPNDNETDQYYLNEFGFWTKTVTEISITVDQLKQGDIAQVDFNKHQNIVMPIPLVTPISRNNSPKIRITFAIPAGRVVQFDDIYVNVLDNSDVYEASVASLNTGKENYELTISSAHSGFYVSNFMTKYSNSGLEKFFSDSRLAGATLTEMNSHAILRSRRFSSLVFEGSIYGAKYSYNEIYNIVSFPDKKFLPLKSSWNPETNVVNITMVEIRNDTMIANVKHYGTNDKKSNN